MSEQINLSMQQPKEAATTNVLEGQWLSLTDAAAITGHSVITLRRYIKSKKLKARRLGKSVNAKLYVYISNDFAVTETDRLSTEGLEDVLTSDVETVEGDEADEQEQDQVGQATVETMEWLRRRLDESQNEVARLNHQLQGASHRNGFLEAQLVSYGDQIKQLTQRQENDTPPAAPETTSDIQTTPVVQKSIWKKLGSWFTSAPS